MPNASSATEPESLLEHAGWVRRLARTLVADAHLAEDLTQDTLMRALEHPPRTDQPVRGWLATVLRNLVAQGRRADGRRHSREANAAQSASGGPGSGEDDLVARVASQRKVVEEVLLLEEPYRTTLLLRFFEELPPRRIAARQNVPVSTVKTRLARGLEVLRTRLDRSHGNDGKAWLRLLLPLVRRPEGAFAPSLSTLSHGALLVNVKVLVACLFMALAGTIAVVAMRGDDSGGSPGVAAAAIENVNTDAQELAVPERRTEGEVQHVDAPRRELVESGAAGVAATAVSMGETPVSVFQGRVIDVDSIPIAGATIGFGDPDSSWGAAELTGTTFRSGAGGLFELSAEEIGTGDLVVADEEWSTVLAGALVTQESGQESVIVVAPRLALAGVVLDAASGLPVEDAHLRVQLPSDFRADFALNLDRSIGVNHGAQSDTSGKFELEQAPRVPGAQLLCAAFGYEHSVSPMPLVPNSQIVIALERPSLEGSVLTGRVVDFGGAPLPGAQVSMGIDVTTTDDSGEFSFNLSTPQSFNQSFDEMMRRFGDGLPAPATLIAVTSGKLPAQFEAPRDPEGLPLWPDYVTLRLGEDSRSITGHVVDAEGEPVPGTRVWLQDPTFFGGIGDPASGARPDFVHVETLIRGEGDFFWNFVETDDNGAFQLEGLLDRDYAVEAMFPDTLLRVVVPNVRAGDQDVLIEMPESEVYAELRGTVVSTGGEPLAGLHVVPMCDAFRMVVRGNVIGTRHATATVVTTDEEGRFLLANVPKDLVYLRIDGAETLPLEWGRHVEGGLAKMVGEDFNDLVITVAQRCHFQVELDDPDEADAFSILDTGGEVLVISEFIGNGRREMPRHSLATGRSNPMAAADSAATLVLYLGEDEVRRVPVRLTPGDRITIRP